MAKNTLKILLAGNKNFVDGTPMAMNKCLTTLQKYAHRQAPHAIVLCCSDSRVVPEIIFDVGIGELFVVRSAGIALGPNIIESIEYGVEHLNIPLLVLLGHDDCGVMKYAVDHYPEPKEYKHLMSTVTPVLKENGCHNDLAKAHTNYVAEVLLEKSKILKEACDSNKLLIVKSHFSFETGKVEIL
ncbi:MAG: hypothetical protein MRZ90_03340 [Candidatus Gastranaerophilales bacterium]|nr:hypothetical protein [Candidatus Gastranaerophilales bacterium]